VDTANTVQDLCGTKTYTIKDSSDNTITTWASIAVSTTTARTYILTIDPAQYPTHFTSDVSETLTVETTFQSWGANNGNTASTIAITLAKVDCNCSKLGWTAPSIVTTNV
jgi:hypothetical protein